MNRAIASLALVKTTWETYRRDYIENFVPFVATLVYKKKYVGLEVENLKLFLEDFKSEYGLSIPHHPMLTILDRARRRGIFKRKGHRLVPVSEYLMKYDFSDVAVKKEAELNKVILKFVEYCDKKFCIKVSEAETLDGFYSFLRNHDLEVLFASQDKTLLPERRASRQLKFLINSFFNNVKTEAPELFTYIVEICIGHVLANTILYNKSFDSFSGHLKDLEIYLDSKYIFRLLGVEGVERERVYVELTNSMLEQGAVLRIFKHTEDEILGIFRSCLYWINSSRYDPSKANDVLTYFISNGKTESDIHQCIATFEDKMSSYKIKICSAPDFSRTEDLQIEENKLTEMIVESYKRNASFNEIDKQETIDKDVKSISAINHLRKGCFPQSLKTSGSIFVTPNSTLAFINKKFEDEIHSGRGCIPACLTDVFVGTLVWMQSPKQWIKINEKKLLADCVAAIQPDNMFIKKMVEEARKLKESGKVSDDEYLAVSRSYVIQDMLMKETLGDLDVLTGASIEEVLRKMRAEAASIPEQLLSAERAKARVLEDQLNIQERASSERRLRTKARITNLVKIIFNIFFSLGILFLIVSIVVPLLPGIWIGWKIISVIFAILIGVANVGYGLNLKGLRVLLVEKASKKIIAMVEWL